MIFPAIEEDVKLENDDNMQIDVDERKDYERRVKKRVRDLKHQRNKINGNIFQKNLEIILNHDPSKKDLLLKELDNMEKDSDNLDSYIDALQRKIELEFQPFPKFISKSKSKSKAKDPNKPKPKPKPVVNVNPAPIRVHEDLEIPNGLLGVRRNLFNKLAAHSWNQDDDLQQRYGISRGDLYFKDYYLFKQ
jgi:hypothetical protein